MMIYPNPNSNFNLNSNPNTNPTWRLNKLATIDGVPYNDDIP
jgi:hypothetical protein